jgi:hypothetical protein
MKKKILNDIKIIIVILIGVTILFAILGTFKGLKENMEDAPQCYSDYHSDVQCYSDVLSDEDHAPYNESSSDKYILKTKIIPPKGTSCPIEISSPASKYLNGITSNSTDSKPTEGGTTTQIQNASNSNSSITSSSSTNITNITGTPGSASGSSNSGSVSGSSNSASNTPVAADSASSTPSSVSGNDAIVQNTATLNELKGSISQINQQKTKPETCPPCPACERCPEPAFDCKKVPNYRSPSIGQYLPMPILNDFSTF